MKPPAGMGCASPLQVWGGALLLFACGAVADETADDAMLFPWQGQLGRPEAHPVTLGAAIVEQPAATRGSLLLEATRRTVNPTNLVKVVADDREAEEGHTMRERKLLADMGRLEREYEASRKDEGMLRDQLQATEATVEHLRSKHDRAVQARRAAEQETQRTKLATAGGLIFALALALYRDWLQNWVAAALKGALSTRAESLRDGVTGGPRDAAMTNLCSPQRRTETEHCRTVLAEVPVLDLDCEVDVEGGEAWAMSFADAEQVSEKADSSLFAEASPYKACEQEAFQDAHGQQELQEASEQEELQEGTTPAVVNGCEYYSLAEGAEAASPDVGRAAAAEPECAAPASPEDAWWQHSSPT